MFKIIVWSYITAWTVTEISGIEESSKHSFFHHSAVQFSDSRFLSVTGNNNLRKF